MARSVLRYLVRLWFTGILVVLTGAGFVFYAMVWTARLVQTVKAARYIILSLLAVAAAVAFYLLVPVRAAGGQVPFVVEQGESLRSVARRLRAQSVIPSSNAFLLWMRLSGRQHRVQAGEYTFERYEGIMSAARRLMTARPIEVVLSLPEGLTVEETAGRIAAVLMADSGEIVRLCRDSVFVRSLGVDASSLEGYLFPETYRFPPHAAVSEVLSRMVSLFRQKYATLEMGTDQARALTQHELVTLASIVEKEAVLDEERPRIAAVFYNRLSRGEPLGADPTVRYALRKPSGPLLASELRNPSPYNTRIRRGLPPGPICSPGYRSLAATAAPMVTSELYFVARWDGSGAHDFSVSQEEHNRKKHAIRRMNESRLSTIKNRQAD